MNRDTAWSLLNEYTKNPALIRHALCVEAVGWHGQAQRPQARDLQSR